MSDNQPKSKPSIFISHKHVDSKISDVLNRFITIYTGGSVKVFQSSSPWADAPQVGRNLNKELRKALWKTKVLILLYTNPNQDWTYCMWECGVASHPESPESKVIVFQCGGHTPALFSEQVNINARNMVDIQKFTDEFLTDPDFFPDYEGPLTQLQPHGREVAEAAAELFQKLQPLLPPEKEDPTEEWPTWPFLRLELSLDQISRICTAKPGERLQLTMDLMQNEFTVDEGDRVAGQLFGYPSFDSGMKFGKIIDRWKEVRTDSQSKWVESLAAQIMDGAQWNFPRVKWELMQGLDNDNWYAPILNRVRKVPNQQCMQFDIYFYKFNVDSEKDAAIIPTREKQSDDEAQGK
jgi:hypothetical protein